ncbi:MAG: GIY-YIG nuclease family protein [Alphaproteobacteria bacterium]|nr:MAG: GIY-YIG nuclease family protein [Alphaproteobacteria bacterium]
MAFWVYILKCSDGSFYTGHTDNLENRVAEHQAAVHRGYTYSRRPVTFMWSETFPSREEALAAELQIKPWNRKKKQALINGDWSLVSSSGKKSFQP